MMKKLSDRIDGFNVVILVLGLATLGLAPSFVYYRFEGDLLVKMLVFAATIICASSIKRENLHPLALTSVVIGGATWVVIQGFFWLF